MHRRAALASVAACAVAMAAVACASAQRAEDFDVHAQLDPDRGTMRLPLDAFALTGADAYAVTQANAALVDACMAQQGLAHPGADLAYDAVTPMPDRTFGLWSEAVARQWGFRLPPSQPPEIEAMYEAMPDDWWEAFFPCLDSVEQLEPHAPLVGDPSRPSPVDRGYREALERAQDDPRWAEARAPWVACLAESGIDVVEPTLLVPVIPADEEAALRTALLDVECKAEHGTAQAIGDIIAQHQAAYAAAHEAELVAYRDEALATLERAREVLRSRA